MASYKVNPAAVWAGMRDSAAVVVVGDTVATAGEIARWCERARQFEDVGWAGMARGTKMWDAVLLLTALGALAGCVWILYPPTLTVRVRRTQ